MMDSSSSIASTTKLLSTVHPVVSDLENNSGNKFG
jgi:hypothetical protein